MHALEVADLHKRYGRVHALRGVSFALEPGEVFGYLGPNGAGKTTTLRIALGLVRADRGSVRLLGEPAGRPGEPRARRLPARRVAAARRHDRPRAARPLRALPPEPAAGAARAAARRARPAGVRPRAPGEVALARHAAEGRAGGRPAARPRPGAARRAHQRARPAGAAGLPRRRARAGGARPRRAALLARALRGRGGVRARGGAARGRVAGGGDDRGPARASHAPARGALPRAGAGRPRRRCPG